MKPLVSIILLNQNGLVHTVECLDSLFATHKKNNYEVIVLDNGSDNNEAIEINKRYGKKIRLLALPTNLGFTGGNNYAIERARGKYLFMLNNDTIITQGCLSILTTYMESNRNVAAVQPKIKWYLHRDKFDYAGACGGYIDRFGYPFTRGRIFESLEVDNGQYDANTEIFWASGAALFIRSNMLKKLRPLFDNVFFNYMEEIDLCWRIWNLGYRIMSVPRAVIFHKIAASTKRTPIKKRFWEHRNNLVLIIKNMTVADLITILPFRIFLEGATYILYLYRLQARNLLALVFAHIHFLIVCPGILINRSKFLKSTRSLPILNKSVGVEYFIKGNDTFKKIFKRNVYETQK